MLVGLQCCSYTFMISPDIQSQDNWLQQSSFYKYPKTLLSYLCIIEINCCVKWFTLYHNSINTPTFVIKALHVAVKQHFMLLLNV